MLGVLAGIVFIGSVGEFVMRSVRGSRDSKGFVLAGLALFVIGYVGLVFARLIKAAVSRQREFLADASSVQFTRNPDGIAGALDQIRASAAGTLIANRYAEEMSHMFFSTAVAMRLGKLFDTHPPLDERIRRVHPRFQHGEYRAKRVAALPLEREGFVPLEQKGRRAGDVSAAWERTPEESAALVGTVDAGKVDFAARLLAALPQPLREGVRSAEGARGVTLALVLADTQDARRSQLEALANEAVVAQARAMAEHVRGLDLQLQLPLLDLALVPLKAAPPGAKQELLAALEAAVNADRRVSLHEFVILALVRSQLAPRPRPAETRRIAQLKGQAATLLALVAHAGTRTDATGEREARLKAALDAGASVLGIAPGQASGTALNVDNVNEALEALRSLAPMEKGVLVKGLFAAVTVDGKIRVAEAGLMRLVGAALDCPLPPLLGGLLPEPL
jgi:Peptidase family M48